MCPSESAATTRLLPAERVARSRCMDHVKLALAALENVEYFLGHEADGALDVSRAGEALSEAIAYLANAHPHLVRAFAFATRSETS